MRTGEGGSRCDTVWKRIFSFAIGGENRGGAEKKRGEQTESINIFIRLRIYRTNCAPPLPPHGRLPCLDFIFSYRVCALAAAAAVCVLARQDTYTHERRPFLSPSSSFFFSFSFLFFPYSAPTAATHAYTRARVLLGRWDGGGTAAAHTSGGGAVRIVDAAFPSATRRGRRRRSRLSSHRLPATFVRRSGGRRVVYRARPGLKKKKKKPLRATVQYRRALHCLAALSPPCIPCLCAPRVPGKKGGPSADDRSFTTTAAAEYICIYMYACVRDGPEGARGGEWKVRTRGKVMVRAGGRAGGRVERAAKGMRKVPAASA